MTTRTGGATLFVEGHDDCHALRHLLLRHDIIRDAEPWKFCYPCIRPVEPGLNKEEVLGAVVPAIATGTGTRVGFVVDADTSLHGSWLDIRTRLLATGVDAPDQIPRQGFVGGSREFETRVGVWIMPNNSNSGALEDFLQSLVPDADPLWGHASTATEGALELGAAFKPKDRQKATLRAWLAWQRDPGLPYGAAIRSKFFGAHSAWADAFVAWFRRLYEADEIGMASADEDDARTGRVR